MSHYIISGSTVKVKGESSLTVSKKLPANNYVVKEDPQTGLYLDIVPPFTVPDRIFGDTIKRANRIMSTFNDRNGSTGILLSGEKGSGKTLLAKYLSVECAKLGYPTIIVNNDWCGDDFNQLIQNIDEPAVVIFDEFEKIYNEEKQDEVLTLLDGVYPTKKLFIITCNDKWRINQHMRNRPGRLYYMLDYRGLDKNFIIEYCESTLKDKKYTNTICKISSLFDSFNFDILKALVEEMNRYNEDPITALEMLNAKPGSDNDANFDVEMTVKGKPRSKDKFYPNVVEGLPIGKKHHFNVYGVRDSDKTINLILNEEDLVKIDTVNGKFVYEKDNIVVVMTREIYKNTNYFKYL
jgi:hypothetical protein